MLIKWFQAPFRGDLTAHEAYRGKEDYKKYPYYPNSDSDIFGKFDAHHTVSKFEKVCSCEKPLYGSKCCGRKCRSLCGIIGERYNFIQVRDHDETIPEHTSLQTVSKYQSQQYLAPRQKPRLSRHQEKARKRADACYRENRRRVLERLLESSTTK